MVQRGLAVVVCLFTATALHSADGVSVQMSGKWRGEGRIIVSWTGQRQLALDLVIQENGQVNGRVGDAAFHGKATPRSAVMRWLGNGDLLISGSLEGPIIAAEGIRRDKLNMMLSFSDSKLTGGMHTSGAKFGGKDRMVLSVAEITLRRPGR